MTTKIKQFNIQNILSENDLKYIDDMINTFKKNKNLELEVSFKGTNYVNYLRMIEHYVDITDKNKITSAESLDISIILSDGNSYRISMFDGDDREKFVQTFQNQVVVTFYDIFIL